MAELARDIRIKCDDELHNSVNGEVTDDGGLVITYVISFAYPLRNRPIDIFAAISLSSPSPKPNSQHQNTFPQTLFYFILYFLNSITATPSANGGRSVGFYCSRALVIIVYIADFCPGSFFNILHHSRWLVLVQAAASLCDLDNSD